ncbi:glycosyltransferase [Calothrix sp. FACHB-1219]|uniref:glycosyltransferase n=1 Tax=unclassified Calothrix TaxID=2619626 RepID=UPI0016852B79|nr:MULTISPECIES: glycosyltransferase [unclassified Calothrix]MBD2205062.1 glycosyltransferase [Calothrix sp. FACHB-168]MBD2219860.1 glycosyltransferase [Calothrix sp. FACHB-1219]
MRVLSVHNRYQIRGGEDESRQAEENMLREMGHQVTVYEEHNDRVAQMSQLQVASRTIWSSEAYQIVQSQLKQQPQDIVHVQNFFPLISPSIYYAAKAEGVPVVQTLRNYRLLCPNGLFFRDGQVCEDCMGKFVPLPGVIHGCYRDNHLASATVATMLTVHRTLGTWTKMVDVFITLTEFARQKFIAGGLPADKIFVKSNFIHPDPQPGEGKGNYAVFVGRLSEEKGLDTLLAAWQQLPVKLPLKIIGDGPLTAKLTSDTQNIPEIELLGRKPMSEVYDLIGEAKFLIFPSNWYETFGRVAVEAFAKGTPVIAADIGAIAELVEHNRTGLKFMPSNSADLAAKVTWLLEHPQELNQMRQEVRIEYETKYTIKQNYHKLLEIYDLVRKV